MNKITIGFSETSDWEATYMEFITNLQVFENSLDLETIENLKLFNFCPYTGKKINKSEIINKLKEEIRKNIENLETKQKERDLDINSEFTTLENFYFKANNESYKKHLKDENDFKKRLQKCELFLLTLI